MTKRIAIAALTLSLIAISYAPLAAQTASDASLVLKVTDEPTSNPSHVHHWVKARVRAEATVPAMSIADYAGSSKAVQFVRPGAQSLETAEVKHKAKDDKREWKDIHHASKDKYSISITEAGSASEDDILGQPEKTHYHVKMKFKLGGEWRVKLKGGATFTTLAGTTSLSSTAERTLPIISIDPDRSLRSTGRAPIRKLVIGPVVAFEKILPEKDIEKHYNKLFNPAGIVIDAAATAETAAIIKPTIILPAEADPDKLKWVIKSVKEDDGTPNTDENVESGVIRARFFNGKDEGGKAHIFGVNEGRIRVEVYPKDKDAVLPNRLDYYEAFVVKPKVITYRVNLLHHDANVRTKTTAEEAKKHIDVANIVLRQLGIKLVPDENVTIMAANATFIGNGIWEVKKVDKKLVDNVEGNMKMLQSLFVNIRGSVMQINYVDSINTGKVQGVTISAPKNEQKDAKISLKYRLGQDPVIINHEMHLAGKGELLENESIFGFLLSNGFSGVDRIGEVIAHETGHVMRLRHRNTWEETKVLNPDWTEAECKKDSDGISGNLRNTMYPYSASTVFEALQDLDLIQLRATRKSKLLTDTAVAP